MTIHSLWDLDSRIDSRICIGCLLIYLGPPWCEECGDFGEPINTEEDDG